METLVEAKTKMMDVMGIEQHHDAVSGTGKQRVADDYQLRMSKVIDQNSDVYGAVIGKEVFMQTGLLS